MESEAIDKTMVGEQLHALLGFLQQDPGNVRLREDAAAAALEAGLPDRALALVADFAGPGLTNLAGLALLQLGRYDEAALRFAALLDQAEDAPALRYNLGYALAMAKAWEQALAALRPDTGVALPQAAALEVGLLHQIGQLDMAVARARTLLECHPDDRGLNASISVLALDVGDEALAHQCAARAGTHPDALTTVGTLALDQGNADQAAAAFQTALDASPSLPRAWIGRGLTRLVASDPSAAAGDLDRGAELFGSHLGSWIAAGWAHLIAGDPAAARERFARAVALDPNFAEAQGSLAVVDLLEGHPEQAERGLRIARSLDRTSFSAALGFMLLAAQRGDASRAQAIFEHAIAAPIDASGRTVAMALGRLGLAGRR